MQSDTLNAVNAMLSDHLEKIHDFPPMIKAMDVLYLISLAAEYLKHVQNETPDVATRLKGEIVFLQAIYSNFNRPSTEIINILKYFEQIHKKLLDAVIHARSDATYTITNSFVKRTIAGAFKRFRSSL